MNRTTNYTIRKRITSVLLLLMVAFAVLALRLFWVQFVRGSELSTKALENRMHDITVEAKRGIIYDRNGKELAISVSTESVFVNPNEIRKSKRAREIAHTLSGLLAMDEEQVYKRITRQSSFEWVKRQVDLETASKLRGLELPGVYSVEESRRFYPKKELACHVLGISGIDNVGLEGVDLYYNKILAGTPGRIVIERDAAGRDIPDAVHHYIPPKNGNSIVLTIDETIQYLAERELDKIWQERTPKAATIIVLDPRNGELLALANRPNFDPNDYQRYPASARRNFAVNNALEPGSTGKIITAAAAMEEGIVNRNSSFYCPGFIKVGKYTIKEAQGKKHGAETFARVMENSCNVGFVQIGQRLGLDRYFRYVKAFGLGQKTGIDLPGEATGILVPEKRATYVDLATMSFGQANAVTPIQLISAVGAVANGGKLMRPHLLKEVLDEKGKVVRQVEPTVVRQVISEQTARELCLILEGVVTNGTGKPCYIEGYRVAGKTGTAQKISPTGGYLANEHVASFIAFAPANDPRLVTLVVVDDPKGYPYYGSTVAAPAARAILEDGLTYLGVPRQSVAADKGASQNLVAVPDLINLPLATALDELNKVGLSAKVEGSGDLVWGQSPRAQTMVNKGSKVIIRLSGTREQDAQGQHLVTVPDLTGKSMREVAHLLGELDLKLEPSGYGLADSQEPLPGTRLKAGETVKVVFKPVTN